MSEITRMKTLTVKSSDVLHGDLAVAPHCRHRDEQLLAAEASASRAQVPALHDEPHDPLVHVQHY